MVFMEDSQLSSKRWASAPRRSDSPCILGAPTSREAAGPPVQLEPVDLSVKTPVVLQVPRYSPAVLITAARKPPSPAAASTTPPTRTTPPTQALPPSICLSTVCKLWNQASRASWYNFKKLDLVDKTWGSVKPISTYFSNLKHVISRCGGVITEIELIGHSRQPGLAENSESFVKILVMCPNLRRLDLGYLRVGINFVRDLTRHCKNLESLTLTRLTSRCNDTVLGDFLFDKLNLRCVRISLNKNCLKGFCLRKLNPEHIEEISITDSRKIDEKLLTDVMPNLKKLHTLNLRNSIYGGSQRSRNSNTTLLLRAICKLESLKVLDISCNYRFVDDVNIVELIPLRDQLTTLCIGNTSVTDVGLANMTSSSSLQSLSVQFLKITGSGFGCMPKLISLNCRFCQRLERNNLLKLLSGSENLNNLHLSHCPIVTKSFVEAVEAVTSCRENYATLTISLNKVKYDTLELSADYRDSLKFEII